MKPFVPPSHPPEWLVKEIRRRADNEPQPGPVDMTGLVVFDWWFGTIRR